MNRDHFNDVYLHMEWADAQIWSAILESPSAAEDAFVQTTMRHIHETQHSFLNAWLDRPFQRWKPEDIGGIRETCEWGNDFFAPTYAFLDALQEGDLDRPLNLPWAKYFARTLGQPPVDTTLRETMHQLSSHSMHHRGQVARRLRVLETPPPYTDYIVWLWSGRPVAKWPL